MHRFKIILWFFFFSCSIKSTAQEDMSILNSTVVTINEIQVSRQEFVCRMQWLKGACFDYFVKQHGVVSMQDNFWRRSINGSSPLQWIKEESLKQLVKEKVTLYLMQRYKVLEGFNYRKFLYAFDLENNKRNSTVAGGGVIYGLQSFTELSFYEYIFSNARLQTQKEILKTRPPAEAVIKKRYEALKEREFKIPKTITVTKITFDRGRSDDPQIVQLKLAVEKRSTKNVSSLIKKIKPGAAFSSNDIVFEPALTKTNEMIWGNVMDKAYKLNNTNMLSAIFTDEDGNDCFLLYKKTILNGYLPFNEVKENLRMLWAEKNLEEMVQDVINKAVVQIESKAWDTLDVDN